MKVGVEGELLLKLFSRVLRGRGGGAGAVFEHRGSMAGGRPGSGGKIINIQFRYKKLY